MAPVERAQWGQPASVSDEQLVAMLVERGRSEGLQLTKRVLESALEGEITDHLGSEKHDPAGKNNGNSRNGTRARTVPTDVGPVEVKVPRDTADSFEPQSVTELTLHLPADISVTSGRDRRRLFTTSKRCWRCRRA